MNVNYGEFIRETAIKNLLSAQEKIAERGDVKGLVFLTKFLLKISNKFNNVLLNLGFEEEYHSSQSPPNESE